MNSSLAFNVQLLQILKQNKKIGILNIAARKAITRKWLQRNAPSIVNLYDIIHEIFGMERMTFSRGLSNINLRKIWKKWKVYFPENTVHLFITCLFFIYLLKVKRPKFLLWCVF